MARGDAQPVLRPATLADVPAILALYRSQVGHGDSDWDEEYPNRDILMEDLDAGSQFVAVIAGNIVGAISACDGDDDLSHLPWTPGHGLYLFRLCVSPAAQGHGLGAEIMRQTVQMAKARGFDAVRLLCAKANGTAQRLYQRLGFGYLGDCFLYETDFTVLEKRMDVSKG